MLIYSETFKVVRGEAFDLTFKAVAVNGLQKITVVTAGAIIDRNGVVAGFADQKELSGNLEDVVSFKLTPQKSTWYSLIIEDAKGNFAMTNPIWIEVVDKDAPSADGIKVIFDGKPVYPIAKMLEGNRILAPSKLFEESIGAALTWDEQKQTITISEAGEEIKISLGQKEAYVNGQRTVIDVPAKMVDDSIFVPLRFVYEALGYQVKWEVKTLSIFISK